MNKYIPSVIAFIFVFVITTLKYQDIQDTNDRLYLSGYYKTQSDHVTSRIRNCIREKARKSNVVHLEECLP